MKRNNFYTVKYIVEHISAILPESLSYRYILSETYSVMNKPDIEMNIIRVKILDQIVKSNRTFFERLKRDIREIMNIYLLLIEKNRNTNEIMDIIWTELGLNSKEKEDFLLYIKGTPFLYCEKAVKERTDLVRLYVDRLFDKEKIIIGLYYFEGLTLKEISQALFISHKDVVINFSLIAFKFLFEVCIKICIKEKNKV